MSKELSFAALRAEFPDASPEDLYNVACERLDLNCYSDGKQTDTRLSWAATPWTACANWMDMYANAPTSYVVH